MISFIVHSSQAQFTTEGKKNLSICLFLLRVLRGEPINQAWVLLRTTSPCVEPTGQRQPVLIAFNCWLLGVGVDEKFPSNPSWVILQELATEWWYLGHVGFAVQGWALSSVSCWVNLWLLICHKLPMWHLEGHSAFLGPFLSMKTGWVKVSLTVLQSSYSLTPWLRTASHRLKAWKNSGLP